MGNPVAHSKSPQIHHAFALQTNIPLHYQAILVPLDGFESAVLEFLRQGGKGLNITVPFKEEAWNLASRKTDRAITAGAVNTISFTESGVIEGDNTDGAGLIRDLARHKIPIAGRRILILGAGGAVRGVLGPVLEQHPQRVIVVNRTLSRAKTLIEAHDSSPELEVCDYAGLEHQGSFDLIINGTSSGLTGDLPPLPETLLAEDGCCYEMMYADSVSPFIAWAKAHGARTAVDGLGMLVEQAAESFFIWHGIRPDTEAVIRLLRGG